MRRLLFASCGLLIVGGSILARAVAAAAQTPRARDGRHRASRPDPALIAGEASGGPCAAQPRRPAQPAAPDPLAEGATSLFAPRWNMFQLSGRFSSVAGDPARWQRYQDLRDGLLLTEGRAAARNPGLDGTFGADNIGWRDQRYFGSYERVGLFKISGLWDEIPQFYSVDTNTAFTETDDGVLVLDDDAQRAAKPQRVSADLPAVRPARAARHRHLPRQRHADVTSTSRAASRRPSTRASCRGARASDSATTTKWRCRTGPATNDMDLGLQWTNTTGDDSRRLQWLVVQQPGRHAGLGQPAGADRFDRPRRGTAGRRCGRPTRCRR